MSLAPLQPIIVVEPKADDGEFSVVVAANANLSINPSEVEQLVVPPVGEVAHMSEEENDTEPDLDAIAASLAAEQPDRPYVESAPAENFVDQEVIRIQPNTQAIYLDCPGLGGSQLFSESAEHVLSAPKVGNRHQVYGPTLAPADKFLQSQVQIARGPQ